MIVRKIAVLFFCKMLVLNTLILAVFAYIFRLDNGDHLISDYPIISIASIVTLSIVYTFLRRKELDDVESDL